MALAIMPLPTPTTATSDRGGTGLGTSTGRGVGVGIGVGVGEGIELGDIEAHNIDVNDDDAMLPGNVGNDNDDKFTKPRQGQQQQRPSSRWSGVDDDDAAAI